MTGPQQLRRASLGAARSTSIFVALCLLTGLPSVLIAQPERTASRVCRLRPVPLPAKTFELKSYATTHDGMLFVADESRVWMRASSGWQEIWTTDPGERPVHALSVIDSAAGEVLLVGAGNEVWEISWTVRRGFAPRYVFRADRRFTLTSTVDVILRNDDGGVVRGYAQDGNRRLWPLVLGPALTHGQAIPIEDGSASLFWARGPGGWSYAWAYREAILHVLGPEGTEEKVVDLAPVFGSEKAGLQSVAIDAERNWIFVASDWGVAVAALHEGTGLPGEFYKIAALGSETTLLVTTILDRLVAVTRSADLPTLDGRLQGPLVWEVPQLGGWSEVAGFAQGAKFERPSGDLAPGYLSSALQIAEDAIWVDASEGLWEWTPAAWRLLDFTGPPFSSALDLTAVQDPQARVLLVPTLLEDGLAVCPPPAGFWSTVQLQPGTQMISALIPDPDGGGVWAEEAPVGTPDTRGYLRFVTPHGHLDTADGTVYGDQAFEIGRLLHRQSDGSIVWPESERGGLLLPAGGQWIHADRGAWRAYDPPPGLRLSEMMPGAKSSMTAWLGIERKPEGDRVIRLDLSENAQAIEPGQTSVHCGTGQESHLVQDAQGFVWLACRVPPSGEVGKPGHWTLRRVHSILGEPDAEREIFGLTEAPSLLFDEPFHQFVLTNRGVAEVSRQGAAHWKPILRSSQDLPYEVGVRGLTIPLARSFPTSPLSWTLLTERRGRYSFDLRPDLGLALRLAAGEVEANPLADLTGRTGRSLVDVFPEEIAQPGVVVWGSGEKIEEATLEWFASSKDTTQWQAELVPALSSIVSAARSSDGKLFAVTDGSRVALHRLPTGFASSYSPLWVPASVKIRHRDGHTDSYDPASGLPTLLPSSVVSADVLLAPWPADWWHELVEGASFRPSPDADWTPVDSTGLISVPLQPDRDYTLEVRVPGTFGIGSASLPSWSFHVAAPPPPPIPWWALALSAAAFLVLAIAASARLRRALLILLGRRWGLERAECDHQMRIDRSGDTVRLALQPSRQAEPGEWQVDLSTSDAWPLPESVAETFRSRFGAGEDVRVAVAEGLFHQPWALALGGPWSVGDEAVVAGQIAVLPPGRTLVPRWARHVRCAALGCTHGTSGLPPLPTVTGELTTVAGRFRSWGAETSLYAEATRGDLLTALREADILHVASHASLSGIDLADGRVTVDDFSPDLLESLRCRLLILSACSIGGMRADSRSLVFMLVRAGVNVLAATDRVDSAVCQAFLEEVYAAFLPSRRARGIRLSAALRQGARRCEQRFGEMAPETWRRSVDAFILYGDPSLHLSLTLPKRGGEP